MITATASGMWTSLENSEMTDENLDEEIDELAMDIEETISETSEMLDEMEGQFDPKYRRMEEASVDVNELFS